MSVQKPGAEHYGTSYKDSVWGVERLSFWAVKLIWDFLFFFAFLIIFDQIFGIVDIFYLYFLFIIISYICGDIISFVATYATVKFIFGLFHRRVKSLVGKLKYKKSKKKLWIYIFTIFFEAIFFYISASLWLAGLIDIYFILAIILAWIVLWFVSRGLARLLYFLFYTF